MFTKIACLQQNGVINMKIKLGQSKDFKKRQRILGEQRSYQIKVCTRPLINKNENGEEKPLICYPTTMKGRCQRQRPTFGNVTWQLAMGWMVGKHWK
jgi:hypothetical protein